MDIDSLVDVGTIGRLLGDLKDSPFETDGIVVAYGTLLLKTQGLGDLVQADFSPGGHRVSRGLRELTVMLGEVALQHGLRLSLGLRLCPSELADEAVLKGTPQSFDSALGMRGARQRGKRGQATFSRCQLQ